MLDVSEITAASVRDALRAMRFARPLGVSPLVGLRLVSNGLSQHGLTDEPAAREWMLGRLLDDITQRAITELRGAGRSTEQSGRRDAAVVQLRSDFLAGHDLLEAWSLLHFHYLAPSPLHVAEIEQALGIAERTVYRRLRAGHELLAKAVREAELEVELSVPDSRRSAGIYGRTSDQAPVSAEGVVRPLAGGSDPAASPYRGLQAFRAADAAHFFGREAFTKLLSESVASEPVVGVVGPSGSGKSSVVYAGLVAGLSSPYRVAEMRPGSRPFHSLAAGMLPLLSGQPSGEVERLRDIASLAGLLREGSVGPSELLSRAVEHDRGLGRLLVVADQYEELFTLCPDEDERSEFQDLLLDLALTPTGGPPVTLALTLRADFMSQALSYRPFADAIQRRDVKLGPMTRSELSRAIRLPAENQGRAFEPGLAERIIDDVGDKAGSLPLLEFALARLWEEQAEGWLTHAAYDRIGRVDGAVARHAEATYEGLSRSDREAARAVFVQLVQPGEGTEDTRRLATRDELGPQWPLVRKLADARLVVTDRDGLGRETAEVVHEAVIRNWSRLRGWMADDRGFRTWQERMRAAARQWEASGRDDDALLRGIPLAEAEQWQVERGNEIAEAEQSYIRASLLSKAEGERREAARVQRERRLERRGERLVRVLLGGALVAAVTGFGLAGAALAARRDSDASAREARRSAIVAKSRELLAGGQADLALALALEAFADGGGTRDAEVALSEAAYAPGTRRLIENESIQIAMSPDGTRLLAAGIPDVTMWDVDSGSLMRRLVGHNELVDSVAFSPDGKTAISTSDDILGSTPDNGVILWDLEEGVPLRRLIGHTSWAVASDISPDGRHALTLGVDNTLRLWDAATGQPIRELPAQPNWQVRRLGFSSDGRRVIVNDRTEGLREIDLDSGAVVRSFAGPVDPATGVPYAAVDVAFEPAGSRMAAGFFMGGGRVWDRDGTQLAELKPMAQQLALLPGGAYLLSSGGDRSALTLWDLAQGAPVNTYAGHTDVVDIEASPDGLTAASADTSRIRIWNVWSSALERMFAGHVGPAAVAFMPSGDELVSASFDGTARLWDRLSGELLHIYEGHGDRIWSVAASPDGALIVTASDDSTARLWEVTSGRTRHILRHGRPLRSAVFSPDGRYVLTMSEDGAGRIWEVQSGREVLRLPRAGTVEELPFVRYPRLYGHGPAYRAIFSPSGRLVATSASSADPAHQTVAAVWDTERRLIQRLVGHENAIFAMAFTAAETTLVTAAFDGSVRWWDLTTGELRHRRDFDAPVVSLSTNAGANRILASTAAGDVLLLDADSGATLRHYTVRKGQLVGSAALSPDGRHAATGSESGEVRTWVVHHELRDLLAWIPTRRHLPELTCDERARFGTERQCDENGMVAQAVWPERDPGGDTAPEASSTAASSEAPRIDWGPGTTAQGGLGERRDAAVDSGSELSRIEVAPGGGASSYSLFSLAIVPGSSVALAGTAAGVRSFDLASGGEAWSVAGEDLAAVPALGVTRDGRLAVSGNDTSNELIAWEPTSGERVGSTDAGAGVYSLAISPEGDRVAFGTAAAIGLWTPGDSEPDVAAQETPGGFTAVAYSPDGRTVLAGGPEGDVQLWDAPADGPPTLDREFVQSSPGHTDYVRAAAFSPDGASAVTADATTMIWWHVDPGSPVATLTEHPGVFALEFSPDGRHLLTTNADAKVRVWDVASLEVVRELAGHTGVRTVAKFRDGACEVVSAGDDGRLIVWRTGLCP